MCYFTAKNLKEMFEEENVTPTKYKGQNFLVSKKVIKKIIKTSRLSSQDEVLEVGAGPGNLTLPLSRKVKSVTAVEKDEKMIPLLKNNLKETRNVKIVKADILNLKIKNLGFKTRSYKMISNLPYYASKAIIRKMLEEETPPSLMTVVLQKEVGEKICAGPGDLSLLGVSVQFYAKVEIKMKIPRNAFWPQPEVDSILLKINLRDKPLWEPALKKEKRDLFFKIVRAGFSHPRKQIKNNLEAKLSFSREEIKDWLKKSEVDPKKRPEDLSLRNWVLLAEALENKLGS